MRDIRKFIADSPVPDLSNDNLRQAELLVFCVHEGTDWSVWGGSRRARYWDALADRVRAATYAGPTLTNWWEDVTRQISSAPRDADHRELVTGLLYSDANQRAVLKALREHASVLVMRVRVHIEYAKENVKESDSDMEVGL